MFRRTVYGYILFVSLQGTLIPVHLARYVVLEGVAANVSEGRFLRQNRLQYEDISGRDTAR